MIQINLILCILSLANAHLEYDFHDNLNGNTRKLETEPKSKLSYEDSKKPGSLPQNRQFKYDIISSIRIEGDKFSVVEKIRNVKYSKLIGQQRDLQSKFSKVRTVIPDTIPLDGIFVPMSASTSERWGFLKQQYQQWFSTCAPSKNSNNARGGNSSECWRYDPMKTLYEIARRSQLLDESVPGILLDAQQTAQEFLNRQDFRGSSGEWPDCSSGVSNMPGVDKCDMKYWGHASAAWVSDCLKGSIEKLYHNCHYFTMC
jgi:hypothetical protein